MIANTLRTARCGAIVLAFTAVGLTAAVNPARAQSGYDYDYGPSGDDVTVTAPRYHGRSAIGAPIEDVSTTRVVYFRDLDVDTPYGADRLKSRIQQAARSACDELDAMYPITDGDSPDCFRSAVEDARFQVMDSLGHSPPGW